MKTVMRCSLHGGVLALLVAAAACAPPPELLLGADSARDGDLGDPGPHGAVLVQQHVRVRGDRAAFVDVVAAADDDGRPLPDLPPVLLLHGGFAPAARYHWLARHLASRGAVVVLPHFIFDLPFFADADAEDALLAVRERSADGDADLGGVVGGEGAVVMGHSLGGVVAANVFDRDPGLSALVLLSSYPDASTTLTRTDGRAISIVGERDGLVEVAEVRAGVEQLQAPAIGAVVAGLTHYQLTDDATDAELAREGTTGDDLAVVRRRALFLIDASREAATTAFAPARWPAGVSPLPESP